MEKEWKRMTWWVLQWSQEKRDMKLQEKPEKLYKEHLNREQKHSYFTNITFENICKRGKSVGTWPSCSKRA